MFDREAPKGNVGGQADPLSFIFRALADMFTGTADPSGQNVSQSPPKQSNVPLQTAPQRVDLGFPGQSQQMMSQPTDTLYAQPWTGRDPFSDTPEMPGQPPVPQPNPARVERQAAASAPPMPERAPPVEALPGWGDGGIMPMPGRPDPAQRFGQMLMQAAMSMPPTPEPNQARMTDDEVLPGGQPTGQRRKVKSKVRK